MTNSIFLLLAAALVWLSAPAQAAEPADQSTASTPQSEPGQTQPAANPASTPATTSANPTTGAAAPATAATAASAAAAQPSKSGSALVPSEVSPGPYATDRKKVRDWLMAARSRGVGLNAYIPVWDDMETSVKSGAPDTVVKTKLDGILKSICEQVSNSNKMQRYRPQKPKPNPDEGIETVRVRWVGGEKGSDPLFRNKADRWYNNAVDMLPREHRSDPEIRRKLHDQRDQIYKEMKARWDSGEKNCGPRTYKNMNQDMHQLHGVVKSGSDQSVNGQR